jgi:hypothetical protein
MEKQRSILQIVEVEDVTSKQLLQLVTGMGNAIEASDLSEAAGLRRHPALSAAGRALRGLYFDEVADEVPSRPIP